AQAGIFPCCVKSFSRWFPASERALPNGLLGSFMSVGGALTTFLTGLLLLFLSWQEMLALLALPGVLFAMWFYVWFRDQPGQHRWVTAAERDLIAGGPSADRPSLSAREGHALPDRPFAGAQARTNEPSPPVPWTTLLTSGRLGLICSQQFFRAAAYVFYVT